MGSYTEMMNDRIFDLDKLDDEQAAENITKFLNQIENFRSFGDGLKELMIKKNPHAKELIEQNPSAFVKECCRKNGVPETDICDSSNTLVNWFKPRGERSGVKEGGPKGGDTNRKKLFALSFALDLNVEETKYLFNNIYFDRAFNVRNVEELIYYYCKKNNRSYNDAKSLVSRLLTIESKSKDNDKTVYTQVIENAVLKADSDDEILRYISEHQNNLSKKNASAMRALEDQKEYALETAKKEASIFKARARNRNRNSMGFLFSMILEAEVSNQKGTMSLFGKNANIRDSIKSNFPEASKLTKKELNFEEIRKLIILLYSYQVWYDSMGDMDKYITDLNRILTDGGLSPLYAGNPYDLMFLYCNLSDEPLTRFRWIISEILNNE